MGGDRHPDPRHYDDLRLLWHLREQETCRCHACLTGSKRTLNKVRSRYEEFAARLHCAAAYGMPPAKELAVGAVIGQPVSVLEFPVQRENTGKFSRLRRVMAMQPSHSRANSRCFHPLKSEQGISLTEQGIVRGLTGNTSVRVEDVLNDPLRRWIVPRSAPTALGVF